jgi:Ca-activated chloride channel family protein
MRPLTSASAHGSHLSTMPWPIRLLLVVLLAVAGAQPGCKSKEAVPDPETPAAPSVDTPAAPSADGPAKKAVTITMVYGSEKKTWLEEQITSFEASGATTASGRPIHVDARAMGSGEALEAIDSASVQATIFSPASGAYVSLLNDRWVSHDNHPRPLVGKSEPLVLSPVVLAMWKPMAEALGWPKKALSWADLLKVNANPKGWGAVGFPEWGSFKFGHCHPEFSNSGLLAVLAEAYAGARKTRELSVADLDSKATVDFLGRVEGTIVHYGKSTGFFADKMIERGPSYLSTAVLYENLIIESYAKNPALPLVAIYPLEGTFWSDHPYAILDADWVGPDERSGAEAFLAHLKARPAQRRAMELGFRPADPAIPVGAPIDAAHGVDPLQPQTVLPVPDVRTIQHLLDVWRANKKGADVVLAFDKSGSMRGRPMEQAKLGARTFLASLGDRDEVTLLFFDATVYPAVGPLLLGSGRGQLLSRLDGISADGGTSLYQAIAQAYDTESKRAALTPNRIHAVVVMTDGKDESGTLSLQALKSRFPPEKESAPVKVFTIAYGDQAEGRILDGIAEAAKGYSARGNVETIRSVYLDMASFF